jgi:hypothetical protein
MENRTEFIKFAVTKSEKENYIKYAKKVFNPSNFNLSEFVRLAIREKIRRIENPNVFQKKGNLNPEMIDRLRKNTDLLKDLKEKQLKDQKIYNELKETLQLIANFNNPPSKEERDQVINLFKAFGELNYKELIEKTGFNKEKTLSIVSILRDEGLLRLKPTGRFILE